MWGKSESLYPLYAYTPTAVLLRAMLRVYAAWNGQSYVALPGGLTRVSTEDSSLVVSMHLGGKSEDTWVLGTRKEPSALRQSSLQVPILQTKEDLPSRLADSLFWLGRYVERVEARVRLVRTLWPAISSEEDFGQAVSLETAIRVLAGLAYLPAETTDESVGEQRWSVQVQSAFGGFSACHPASSNRPASGKRTRGRDFSGTQAGAQGFECRQVT
jgi:A predicted alpha-helical domain with a conserved ER motif.